MGHVIRAQEERTILVLMKWMPDVNTPRGIPGMRRRDDVINDLRVMRVRDWRMRVPKRKM